MGSLEHYKFVYDEAVRGIEGQREAVDEIRSRCGILLSAAAILAGFLGPDALKQGAQPIGVGVAAFALVLTVAPTVFILLPTRGWAFTLGTQKLLADYVETDPPASMEELYRSIAWYLEIDWEENRKMLKRRYSSASLRAASSVRYSGCS